MPTATDRSTKWNKRLYEGGWFKRGFWWVVYGGGRFFSAGKWNPFSKYTFSLVKEPTREPSTNTVLSQLEKLPKEIAQETVLSQLEELPQEIAEKIARRLDKNALSRLAQTSRKTHSMFQESLKVAELLDCVKEADYEKAKKMIDADPLLMFQDVSYKKADGSYEMISSLKFAFKMLDTYMWKMFYEKIKNDRPELLERFTEQAHAQTEQVDLEPLYAAYRTYDEKYPLWAQNSLSNKELLDEAWLKVGKMQREILPRHMLKEFCRKDKSWSVKSKFDVDSLPAPAGANVYNYKTRLNESLLPFLPNSGLGFDFSLIRGLGRQAVAPELADVGVFAVNGLDAATFRRLYEVRTNDLVNLRSQLKPASKNVSKMVK